MEQTCQLVNREVNVSWSAAATLYRPLASQHWITCVRASKANLGFARSGKLA